MKTSAVLLKDLEKIMPAQAAEPVEKPEPAVKEESAATPIVPDRKNKPKFLNGKIARNDSDVSPGQDLDDSVVNDDDNESLISGVERLSVSPAPVPAPRKSLPNNLSELSLNNKHTYQNVPIPISPNISQEVSPNGEVRPSHPTNTGGTGRLTRLVSVTSKNASHPNGPEIIPFSEHEPHTNTPTIPYLSK